MRCSPNLDVRIKFQAAIGQELKTKVAWPYLKVFWLREDNAAVHCERHRQKKRW